MSRKQAWRLLYGILIVMGLGYLIESFVSQGAFVPDKVVRVDTVPVFVIDTVPGHEDVYDESCDMLLTLMGNDKKVTIAISHINLLKDNRNVMRSSEDIKFDKNGVYRYNIKLVESYADCSGNVVRFKKPRPEGDLRLRQKDER